jgi:hypothetical protein
MTKEIFLEITSAIKREWACIRKLENALDTEICCSDITALLDIMPGIIEREIFGSEGAPDDVVEDFYGAFWGLADADRYTVVSFVNGSKTEIEFETFESFWDYWTGIAKESV